MGDVRKYTQEAERSAESARLAARTANDRVGEKLAEALKNMALAITELDNNMPLP